ncbi:class I SAM-dependent methyltransferase [Fodinibius sp. AD559]|uniref:class I SAM-dependent methyltransferase n=1 Tax=Fodinibius sp. AD559 TaxID=3424179 RepID=UPI004046C649
MKPDQLSKTAAFIAIKFYGLTRLPTFRSLFNDPVINFYNRTVRSLPFPLNYYHYWLKFDWVRQLYIWSEELLLPGDLLHIIARKYYIRQLVNELIDDGYEQIVVLGAGFDDLAFAYSQKGLSCFELEVPHMAKYKKQFLNQYYPERSHPDIISTHLTDNKQKLPLNSRFNINSDLKTIIVAEGFFDYLQADLVENILTQIQDYFSGTPALICTHFALDELPTLQKLSFKTGVKTVGEELKLHHNIKEFRTLLTRNGFSINRHYDHTSMANELQKLTGTELSVLKGFYLLMSK